MSRWILTTGLLVVPGFAFAHPYLSEPWLLPAVSESKSSVPVAITVVPATSGVNPAAPAPAAMSALAWPQSTRSTVVSPVFSDLDGNGSQEVITADDRFAYVFDANGVLLAGWPREIGGANEHAAVADLEGDGSPEILIGSNFPNPRLWALTPGGAVKPGWPVDLPFQTIANTTCPVVADLLPGGALEVGIATESGVSFFTAQGLAPEGWPYLWPVQVNNPQWSAPAVCDLDNDGSVEIVVGNVNFPDWGVHVVRADGTSMPGWPKVIRPVWSSPAVADLDGDGDLEIIVQEGDPGSQGNRMWVWHHDGTTYPGWPRVIAADGQSSRCSPAVADLDGGGGLEIVTVTGDGVMHIFTPGGMELAGWSTGGVQPISSPAVIDVDDDGVEEIFLAYWLAQEQFVAGWRPDGSLLPGFPFSIFAGTDLNAHASVHVADADGDGNLELTVSGSSFSQGRVWVMGIDPSVVNPTTRQDWPKIRRDRANTGCFPASEPAALGEAAAVPSARAAALRVGPNPAFATDPLAVWTPEGSAGRLVVRDLHGRVLGSQELAAGRTPHLLPFRSLSPGEGEVASGVYFLTFEPHGRSHSAATSLLVVRR